jgi:hypothetical protein
VGAALAALGATELGSSCAAGLRHRDPGRAATARDAPDDPAEPDPRARRRRRRGDRDSVRRAEWRPGSAALDHEEVAGPTARTDANRVGQGWSDTTKHKRRLRVPAREDWLGYDSDVDVRNAHKLLFGKSIAEVQQYFGGVQSIQRANELLFMPRRAFQYYVMAFAEFVTSENARGDSDTVSSFLRLLISRERRDPGSVAQVFGELAPAVDCVASKQLEFDADPNIYGRFAELADQLRGIVFAWRHDSR